MTRLLPATLSLMFLLPIAAMAQQGGANHGAMDRGAMNDAASTRPAVREGGQSAFAAIAEIVALLAADPATDWKSVDVESLRRHLIDMDNVTLRAQVAATPTDAGARFEVWSDNPSVQASIRRMVAAHVATMNGANGWTLTAAETERGATLDLGGKAADLAMIQGLGFIGVMTFGTHHQTHHWAIASGQNPHL